MNEKEMKRTYEFSEELWEGTYGRKKEALEAGASGRVQSGHDQTELQHVGRGGGKGEAREGSWV